MNRDVLIRAFRPSDLAAGIELLEEAGLPTADVSVDRLALVAESDAQIVGVIGLEQYAHLGLLRSLVVDSGSRKDGLGRQLVDTLEHLARARGVTELWLLTIDADAYFATLGFSRQPRTAAPAAIAASEEFSSLCPDDAVLMSRPLDL